MWHLVFVLCCYAAMLLYEVKWCAHYPNTSPETYVKTNLIFDI